MIKISTRKKRLSSLLVTAMVLSQIQVNGIAAPVTTDRFFNDVKENVWYSEAVNKWGQSNIIAGYEDGSFRPQKEVTRAELAAVIDRIFALEDTTNSKSYKDVDQAKWYQAAIDHISSAGIMNDAGENFNPNEPATREELAYAFSKAYKLSGTNNKEFKDQEAISDWATEAVNALIGNGYMVGMPDGNFAPKAHLTRAEMIVVIDRLTSTIIKEAGTYKESIDGNLVVNTKDVILKDMTISGNLYLAEGIGTGDITLDNITVKGTIFVEGGGENSVKLNNVSLAHAMDIEVIKPVRIVNKGKKISVKLRNHSKVILEGDFSEITVPYNVILKLNSSLIADKLITLPNTTQDKNADMATIEMVKGSVIQLLVADGAVKILGQGEIKQLNENVTGVKTEVTPIKVVTASGVQSSIHTNTSSGSSSSGDSSSGENEPDTGDTVDPTKWKLAWSDEFNGNQVDTTKWTYNNGFLNLNEEKQVYQSENATVGNGKLTITAKKEDTIIDGVTHKYTSARMVSKGRYAQKYGKVEVRAKLPLGKSLWPAIWMLPENDEYTGWPSSGEIDIMESRGSVPNQVWGTLHYGEKKPDNSQSGSSYTFPEGESINGFHTYGIEWQPGEIRWYVDGKLYQTQDNWFTTDPETGERYAFPAPFDKEFHMILNLALGGWYDGVGTNLEVDDSIFDGGKEYAMEVDYVRFYESIDGKYPEAVDPDSKIPDLPGDARKPLTDGNLIYDNTYTAYGIQDNQEGNLDFGEGWNLLYKDSFGGDAVAAVEPVNGMPFAKITVKDPGNQDYSIQMIQHTTLGRGRTYKLSFDAKAESNRDIHFKVGGGEARGYAVYSDSYSETLSTEVKHIEKTFTMKNNTDIAARFEFNLGLDANDVWIGNVKLEEVESEPAVEDFNQPKVPLKNGSLIYNGTFDKGKLDRLTYWNLEVKNGGAATMSVPESTRDLHIKINQGGSDLSNITLDQRGLKLGENASYTVVFKGKAQTPQSLKVKLLGEDGQTIYAEKIVDLTTEKQKYEFVLQGQGASTNTGRLVFEMGGVDQTNIVLDEISVVETRQDFSNVNIFPLKNGDFSNGLANWNGLFIEGGKGEVTFDGEAKFSITDLGANPWSVMLAQNNVPFSAGVKYVISFEASSELPRDMVVKTEEEGTWRAFFEKNVTLTPEKQKYSFEYTMPADGDKDLGLKFLIGTTPGAPEGEHIVTIDNIVCEVKDGLQLKSEIKNGQFNNELNNWSTYIASDAGAKADITVVDKALQVDISDLGQNPWEIQISQKGIKLEKGKTYQIGFKAKSEAATKLKVSVGHEAEDYSYTNYLSSDQFFDMTETENQYAFKFTMTNETDANAKISLDAGKQEGAVPTTINLDDIYLTEVPGEENEEEGGEDTPTSIINLLQNGDFENQEDFKWNNWKAGTAEATFIHNGGVQVDIDNSGADTWQITLEQSGISVKKGKAYGVKFDANVTTASSLRIALQDTSSSEYIGEYAPTINLQEGNNTYEYEFTVTKEDASNLSFKFQMGYDQWTAAYHNGKNQITLDNVILYEKPAEESGELVVTLDDLILVEKGTTTNILQDGDFSSQGDWVTGGPNVTFDFAIGAAEATITNEGTNPWDVIIFQPDIALEKGKAYSLSFKGKANRDKKIRMLTSNASYAEYFFNDFELTNDFKDFTYEFVVGLDTSSALEFKIFMGGGIS